jgi:hypothetical protein
MAGADRRNLGRVFDEVPALYDRVRPTYSTSPYRRLDRDVREPLLDAIADRVRTRMGDRASRRYLSVLRVGLRAD